MPLYYFILRVLVTGSTVERCASCACDTNGTVANNISKQP